MGFRFITRQLTPSTGLAVESLWVDTKNPQDGEFLRVGDKILVYI